MSDNERAAVDSGSSLQAGTEQTMARLLIRNLPPDTDKEYLEMFFENRRKFGDVEMVDVEINENMSRALVKFKTQSDVKAVISREPITMKGRTIQLVEVKTQPMDIVVVKGHVDIVNKDNSELLEMYFESQKRSSGGEVTDVSYDCRQNACFVKFKDEKVAKRVVEQEKHTLQGHSLSVCLYDKLTAVLDGYESDDTTLSNQRRTVKVTGVRQLMTQSHDILHLYFESRKSSGGDLHEIKTDEHDDDVIYVEFKHGKDARSVADKQDHTLQNVNLHTELLHPPPKLMLHGNKLFIQGLSKGTTRTALELFLEAKCRIIPEYFTYHPEKQDCVLVSSKSKIDFENMKDAIHKFQLDGRTLDVSPVHKSCSILVGKIPRGLSADTMQQYFENRRRSSGGSVKSIAFAEDSGICQVTFSDPETVERVLNTDHVIENQRIHLAEFLECVQSSERNLIEKSAVFRQVSVKVDESKMGFIKQSKKTQAELVVIMKEQMCDVDLSQSTKLTEAILSFGNHGAVPLSFHFIQNWAEMAELSFKKILAKISSTKLPLKKAATKHVIQQLQDDLNANKEDVTVSIKDNHLEIDGNEKAIKASVKWFYSATNLKEDDNKSIETLALREIANIKLSETTRFHLVQTTVRGMLVDVVVCPISAANDVQIDQRDEIIKTAGYTIEKECQKRTEDNMTFVTKSGHLPCRQVIHTVGFHGKENDEHVNENLSTVLCRSLAKAKELKASSVAFPFIDWGLTRMTPEEVTRETLRSFKMFVADNEDLPIEDVYLCSGIRAHVTLLLKELLVQFQQDEVVSLDKGFGTEKDQQRHELEQSGNDELADIHELVLYNLPGSADETTLVVYFEDYRKFGHTKVSHVRMNADSANASVFFQDKTSLQNVLSKQPFTILSQRVNVKLDTDAKKTVRVHGPSDMAIFVNDNSDFVRAYFEHPRSFGGPVLHVIFNRSPNCYLVTFVDLKDAENVLARKHVLSGQQLVVSSVKAKELLIPKKATEEDSSNSTTLQNETKTTLQTPTPALKAPETKGFDDQSSELNYSFKESEDIQRLELSKPSFIKLQDTPQITVQTTVVRQRGSTERETLNSVSKKYRQNVGTGSNTKDKGNSQNVPTANPFEEKPAQSKQSAMAILCENDYCTLEKHGKLFVVRSKSNKRKGTVLKNIGQNDTVSLEGDFVVVNYERYYNIEEGKIDFQLIPIDETDLPIDAGGFLEERGASMPYEPTADLSNRPAMKQVASGGKSTMQPEPSRSPDGRNQQSHQVDQDSNMQQGISDVKEVGDYGPQRTQKKPEEIPDDPCVICMDTITNPKKLPCGHWFCTECIDNQFKVKPACLTCFQVHGVITGDQPPGYMTVTKHRNVSCEGYRSVGTISINYNFLNGRQTSDHPNPGQFYKGISRIAYLPDNEQGKDVCRMLKVAFQRKLVFTIGSSRTTGKEGVITWNDIRHKTDARPHSQFGYPDPTYLDKVTDELKAKGVTKADIDNKGPIEGYISTQ